MRHRESELLETLIDRERSQSLQFERAETRERGVIVARYTTNAAANIADITESRLDFEDLDIDPRSTVTTGASWVFTAPVGGYYLVIGHIFFAASTTWAPTDSARLSLYKNGGLHQVLDHRQGLPAGSNIQVTVTGSGIVSLAKGDTVYLTAYQNTGGALALSNDGNQNWVAISRL